MAKRFPSEKRGKTRKQLVGGGIFSSLSAEAAEEVVVLKEKATSGFFDSAVVKMAKVPLSAVFVGNSIGGWRRPSAETRAVFAVVDDTGFIPS